VVKRVSLKGKGAEIFFGDSSAIEVDQQGPKRPLADRSNDHPAVQSPSQSASSPACSLASMQESKPARNRQAIATDTKAAPPQSVQALDVLQAIYDQVAARATVTNAFRYTDRELSLLTDALYQLGKRHGTKLTKQDVARLGLNAVLWDHETRGDDSLLTQLALRRKRERGGNS
jgi:hypothetical protein